MLRNIFMNTSNIKDKLSLDLARGNLKSIKNIIHPYYFRNKRK